MLYSDGQLIRADSLLRSRLEFGDDNVLVFFYLGRIAVEQDRLEEAKEMLGKATQKEPAFADGWLNLGYVYRQQDSLALSIATFNKGLETCREVEDRTRLLFAVGSTQERRGEFESAVATFKDLIALDPNNGPALNYLGYMLADRGVELDYARVLVEKAVALSPDNGAYLDSYAWVFYKMGDYAQALVELKKALAVLDNDATVYEHLGDIHRALGNTDEAQNSYRKALEINPDNPVIEEKLK
jgi:tetratricopeptide (TPR) repeat protein